MLQCTCKYCVRSLAPRRPALSPLRGEQPAEQRCVVRTGGLEHGSDEDQPDLGMPEPKGKGRRAAAGE